MNNRFAIMFAVALLMTGCQDDDEPVPTPTNPVVPMTNPVMYIQTESGHSIDSKEQYLRCTIQIDGRGVYDDYATQSATGDSIRGRGNSSWLWYPKKPYKIKLGQKASLCGIGAGKKYVLLANYRDPTRMMNAVVFDMATYMGMPYTNTSRYIEVYVNDEYAGLYQLTEQVERGTNRVDIDREQGLLLALDYDDGPDLSPDAGDNFYSEVFSSSYSWRGLPVCVKHPEDLDLAQIADIKAEFAQLERVIAAHNYTALRSMCDVQSMMDFLILQELTRNVELVTPRSMYLFRDADGIWRFGPVWDFDGGFGYDWGEQHNYFASQSWLMGPQGSHDIPDFFDGMFANTSFVADYKARWNAVGTGAIQYALEQMDCRLDTLAEALERDEALWNIGRDYLSECDRLSDWLQTRARLYNDYLNQW